MATTYTDYDIPDDWDSDDLVEWMNGHLALSDVKSVEFFITSGNLWARVHDK